MHDSGTIIAFVHAWENDILFYLNVRIYRLGNKQKKHGGSGQSFCVCGQIHDLCKFIDVQLFAVKCDLTMAG